MFRVIFCIYNITLYFPVCIQWGCTAFRRDSFTSYDWYISASFRTSWAHQAVGYFSRRWWSSFGRYRCAVKLQTVYFMGQRLVLVGKSILCTLNPLTAKLFNLNFHPLEVVSRWRDKWVKIIHINWQNGGELFWNLADWCHILSLTCLKGGTEWVNKNENPNICGTGG